MRIRRRGSMMLEAAMAVTLSAVALVAVTQLLITSGRQQRIVQRRQLANRAAGNVMEHVMIRPYHETTNEMLASIALPAEVASRLPASSLRIIVADSEEDPAAKRIEVAIAWQDVVGNESHVRLVAWKYAKEQ